VAKSKGVTSFLCHSCQISRTVQTETSIGYYCQLSTGIQYCLSVLL